LAVAAWSNRIRCRIGFERSLISGITMLETTARQRQVVELDVAADVGLDAGGEVFQHLAR
jgi:hypothetical protein